VRSNFLGAAIVEEIDFGDVALSVVPAERIQARRSP
jgi:hypothetical protein